MAADDPADRTLDEAKFLAVAKAFAATEQFVRAQRDSEVENAEWRGGVDQTLKDLERRLRDLEPKRPAYQSREDYLVEQRDSARAAHSKRGDRGFTLLMMILTAIVTAFVMSLRDWLLGKTR